jgi:phosphoribosylformylglycinamidine synthase
MVVRPGTEPQVEAIFDKWALDVAVIGRVTDTREVVVKEGEREVCRLPVSLVVDEAPSYDRPTKRPALERRWRLPDLAPIGGGEASAESRLLRLLARPTIASKRDIYEQYDSMVRASTVHGPGAADAAVLRLPNAHLEPTPETLRGLAMTVDMNGRYVELDPRRGALLGVLEAARNLVCVGAEPKATTDCLNFGSPERPEVMWSLVEAIEGLAEGCRLLETPVVSGNVSLYNETEGRAILPTPTIGMVGVVEDVTRSPGMGFRADGDRILLLGALDQVALGGSEIVLMETGELRGRPAVPDVARARSVHAACLQAARAGYLASAHDAAEGGLLVALAESAIAGGRGAQVSLPERVGLLELFGEGPSLIVVSTSRPEDVSAVAEAAGAPWRDLGAVGGDALRVDGVCALPLDAMREAWDGGLRRALESSTPRAGRPT